MKLYCLECKKVFDEDEIAIGTEFHPEVPTQRYERFATSPCCHTAFCEAAQCKMCGTWYAPDDLVAGVYCQGCIEDMMTEKNLEDYARSDPYYFAEFIYDREQKK